MNPIKNKKSEMFSLVLIVLILVVFLGWLINFNSKECRSNSQCDEGFYCGSDFSCHQIPVIEKNIVKNNLVMPSIIIGIAIIVAALIIKSEKFKMPFGKNPQNISQNIIREDKNRLKAP